MSFRDNEKIVNLLMEYREEALRLSAYYQQVANDILWYNKENQSILQQKQHCMVNKKIFGEETVIVGSMKRDTKSYHANLQEVVKEELYQLPSIRKMICFYEYYTNQKSARFTKKPHYNQ